MEGMAYHTLDWRRVDVDGNVPEDHWKMQQVYDHAAEIQHLTYIAPREQFYR